MKSQPQLTLQEQDFVERLVAESRRSRSATPASTCRRRCWSTAQIHLDTRVRAHAGVNSLEGIGMAEAPRGILIHHYKVDEQGAIRWANLIIATGHNNLAINRSIEQVSRHFVDGKHLKEGMLNRVSAVVRVYDPCLSCSTHAAGRATLQIQLVAQDGKVLDELRS